MKIRNIIGTSLIVGTSLLVTACYSEQTKREVLSRRALLEEVMSDKLQSDYNKLSSSQGNLIRDVILEDAQLQHNIDSVVFREIFEGSEKAKDSTFINDYNKMMSNTKVAKTYDGVMGGYTFNYNETKNKIDNLLTVREIKQCEKTLGTNAGCQFVLDSASHHKLFEKYNLLNDSTITLFKNLCKKVKP